MFSIVLFNILQFRVLISFHVAAAPLYSHCVALFKRRFGISIHRFQFVSLSPDYSFFRLESESLREDFSRLNFRSDQLSSFIPDLIFICFAYQPGTFSLLLFFFLFYNFLVARHSFRSLTYCRLKFFSCLFFVPLNKRINIFSSSNLT